jgi:hypothetical protein
VNQIVDSCLVGTWRMTSSQVENSEHTFRLAGGAGATMRVWPDGKTIQDYNKGAAQTATYGGDKYSYTLRGVYTSRTETSGGRAYFSDFSGGLTGKMVRNGRTQYQRKSVPTADDLPYIARRPGSLSTVAGTIPPTSTRGSATNPECSASQADSPELH